mmetsp:Transcript_11449/g.26858  ORF Transcript_11449/g.26858 Transcript_11449/m.26858 type:complete len:373 (-) Transcript_11449:731-1849(-)
MRYARSIGTCTTASPYATSSSVDRGLEIGSKSSSVPNFSTTACISCNCFPEAMSSLMISFRRASDASLSSSVSFDLGLSTVLSYRPMPYLRWTTKSPGKTSRLQPPALPTLIPMSCSRFISLPSTNRGPSSPDNLSSIDDDASLLWRACSSDCKSRLSSLENHDSLRPLSMAGLNVDPSSAGLSSVSVGSSIVSVTPACLARFTLSSSSCSLFFRSSSIISSTSSSVFPAYFPISLFLLSSFHLLSSSSIISCIFACLAAFFASSSSNISFSLVFCNLSRFFAKSISCCVVLPSGLESSGIGRSRCSLACDDAALYTSAYRFDGVVDSWADFLRCSSASSSRTASLSSSRSSRSLSDGPPFGLPTDRSGPSS